MQISDAVRVDGTARTNTILEAAVPLRHFYELIVLRASAGIVRQKFYLGSAA